MKQRRKNSVRLKNVTKISLGTLIGQIISLVTVPIFTRIYGVEILGVWAFLNAIYLFINSFSSFGLTYSIMTEKDERERIKIYTIVTTIGMLISIIVAIVLGIVYGIIRENNTGLSIIFLIFYSFMAIFIMQQIQTCYTWLNKEEKYSILMKNSIVNNITFGVIGIGLGLIEFKQYGYLIGWLIGQIFTLIYMKRYMPKRLFNFNWQEYKEVFQNNRQFLKYQLPANIIYELKNQIPTFLIESYFGKNILGYYSIATRILNIPITLLGNSVGKVFFQEASDKIEKGEAIGEFTYENIRYMMKISIVPMILLIGFGKLGIAMILGKDWLMAGEILTIMAFQTYFIFLTASIQGVSINIHKQKYDRNMYLVQAISSLIAFAIGFYIFHHIYICLIIMTILFVITNLMYFYYLFKALELSTRQYWKDMLTNLLIIAVISLSLNVVINKIFF